MGINASRPGAAGRGSRVLVLDDHALSRDYTVAALRQAGHAVKAEAEPAAALTQALRWLPEVVIVDIDLPGIDGWTWLGRLLNAWPRAAARPRRVVLSADADRCAVTGLRIALRPRPQVHAILSKPATPADLVAAVAGGARAVGGAAASRTPRAALLPALRRGLQRDLRMQLPLLDERLAAGDFAGAASLLHRLIASSRMCRQRALELRLLKLYERVRDGNAATADAGEIAALYFALVSCAARSQRLAGATASGSGAAFRPDGSSPSFP